MLKTGQKRQIRLLATAFGFAMVWYIWWLAIVSFLGVIVVSIAHTFNYHRDHHIPAHEVNQFEHSGNWTPDAEGAAA